MLDRKQVDKQKRTQEEQQIFVVALGAILKYRDPERANLREVKIRCEEIVKVMTGEE